jgi:hypothetical protein
VVFLALLLWRWRLFDLFNSIPSYGDTLEVIWGIGWYDGALHLGQGVLFEYPKLFHPEGWQVGTYAVGPASFLPLLPLNWIGGPAFAFNAGVLGLIFISYAGTFKLTRALKGTLFAAVFAGLLYTFWGMRWIRINGHFNILLGSALLPWMVWALEMGFRSGRRSIAWSIFAGLLWALAMNSSLYFLWLGGFVIVGWIAGRFFTGSIDRRTAIASLLATTFSALVLSLPAIIIFWQGKNAAQTPLFGLYELNSLGANLNSLFIPSVFHPWLNKISRTIYKGPLDASGTANLGLLAVMMALLSIPTIWRNREWRPLLILFAGGLILAIGLNAKWDNMVVQLSFLEPVNQIIWRIGHLLKPGLFQSNEPVAPMREAIPMPGLLLAAVVPFWEGARVSARFALAAGLGMFLMISLSLSRLRPWWIRGILATLLIVELITFRVTGVPFPNQMHPAFDWIRENTPADTAIVDLHNKNGEKLLMKIGGETILATEFHDRATASGASSIWPAHADFLNNWLARHEQSWQDPAFLPILRSFGINYIVFHQERAKDLRIIEEVILNEEVALVDCFSPNEGVSPWPYPICVLEILPAENSATNLMMRAGWSGAESWGIWAEGNASKAQWVATAGEDHTLIIEAFPFCLENQMQEITISANGHEISSHRWDDCDTWQSELNIPGAIINVGWNDLAFEYGYSTRPTDIMGEDSNDNRPLSVGFSTLLIQR